MAIKERIYSFFQNISSDLKQLFRYRGLVYSLVIRDLRIKYKSSVLGFFWSLLHPLLMMGVYAIIFTILIRQKVEGPYSLFLLAGILPWLFFAGSLSLTAPSLLSNSTLINKVFFPREILPLAIILSNLINFLLSLIVFFFFLIFTNLPMGMTLFSLPLLIFFHFLFTFGLTLFLAPANVYFRDIDHIIDIVLQLWFFSVPVIYSIQFLFRIAGKTWLYFYFLNPMVSFTVMYRDILMYSRMPSLSYWLFTAFLGIVSFLAGYSYFKRVEFDVVKEI